MPSGRKPRSPGALPSPLTVKWTSDERSRWTARAEAAGLDLSALVRSLLDAPSTAEVDALRAEVQAAHAARAELADRLEAMAAEIRA